MPQAFRDALGIEWQKRVVNGVAISQWVQTKALRFKEGDYLSRCDGGGAVQVQAAQPASDGKGGYVRWLQYSKGESMRLESGTQEQFLTLLQCGLKDA